MQALLLIDIQRGFLSETMPPRNNPEAEFHMKQLLNKFRAFNLPVIHIQHISLNPDSVFSTAPGYLFQKGFEPKEKEPLFTKHVNSAFIGTLLTPYLVEHGIDSLTIAGLTLPHCVSTTVRMAGNLGYDVTLVEDATASYALPDSDGILLDPTEIHRYHIAALRDEFATIATTEQALARL